MSFEMTFEGIDELDEALERIRKKAPKAFARGLYVLSLDILNDAKRNAPVDTSNLRNSGYRDLPKFEGKEWFVIVGFSAPYAVYVHEGTSNMGARKFLAKAIEKHSANAKETIVEEAMVTMRREGL